MRRVRQNDLPERLQGIQREGRCVKFCTQRPDFLFSGKFKKAYFLMAEMCYNGTGEKNNQVLRRSVNICL